MGANTSKLAFALMLLWNTATAEVTIVKDFRYPFVRTSIVNPQSLPNPCQRREYRVLHRRDSKGRPYDLEVTQIGDAELELIPSVIESFRRWRFKVPMSEDWKAEFLSIVHENTFQTSPPCDCNVPRGDSDASCENEIVDEDSLALIERIFAD
jgi:hypothetical protein